MKPITANDMRDINRTCILEYLRQKSKASRSQIAEDLELSLSSVVRITDELMEEKLIRLQGEYESTGGRRRHLIEMDAQHNAVISVSLGAQNAQACICNITGEILYNRMIQHNARGEECVPLLRSLIDEALQAKSDQFLLRGIVVGVPGVVADSNRVTAAPAIGMDNCYLADALSPYYDYSVLIENDVNLAALGEMWFGYGKQCSNMVYIQIGTLLGMGIIFEGGIFRGAHRGAGELGYMIFRHEELEKEYRQLGALEEYLSGYGLQKTARKKLEQMGRFQEAASITAKQLFVLAKQEAWAKEIIEDFEKNLAMVIIDIAAILDTEMIVLGGGVMISAKDNMEQIRAHVKGKVPSPIQVEHSALGRKARILGGCVSILYHVLRYRQYKGLI